MQSSHFSRLPPEIRLKIWALTLTHDAPLCRPKQTSTDCSPQPSGSLGLLRTCKAIKAEAINDLYANNIFHLRMADILQLAWNSPEATSTKVVHIRREAFRLTVRTTLPLVELLMRALKKHCPELHSVRIIVTGYVNPALVLPRSFITAAIDVGKWECTLPGIPDLKIAVEHKEVSAGWRKIKQWPSNPVLEAQCREEMASNATPIRWPRTEDTQLAVAVLGLQYHEQRERFPDDTANHGSDDIVMMVQDPSARAAQVRPSDMPFVPFREIAAEDDAPLLDWASEFLVHVIYTDKHVRQMQGVFEKAIGERP